MSQCVSLSVGNFFLNLRGQIVKFDLWARNVRVVPCNCVKIERGSVH